MFGAQRERIGFEGKDVAVHAFDLILIESAGAEVREEELPDADAEMAAHRMAAAVPLVELTHDADAARVRRPHGEDDAVDTVDGCFVRAEAAVELEMVAFGDEVEVHRAEKRREAVG